MILLHDTRSPCFTIKSTIGSENHVRVGLLSVNMWIAGEQYPAKKLNKPNCEYTINECMDLLVEMERRECCMGVPLLRG